MRLFRLLIGLLPRSFLFGINGVHAYEIASVSSLFWYSFLLLLVFYASTIYFQTANVHFSSKVVKHGKHLLIATDVVLMFTAIAHAYYPAGLPALKLMIDVLLLLHSHHLGHCIGILCKRNGW